LVQKYDIKCLKNRVNDGPCPPGGLNPFYTGDLYFELDTMKYWEELGKTASNK